jgi:hypothetical protein
MSSHMGSWVLGICTLGVMSPQASSEAQKPTSIKDTLVVDHAKRSAWYISGASRREIKENQKLRIRPSKNILVIVRETNSAFYDYTLKTETSAAPELTALRTYLSSLGPYALELNTLFCRSLSPRRHGGGEVPPGPRGH